MKMKSSLAFLFAVSLGLLCQGAVPSDRKVEEQAAAREDIESRGRREILSFFLGEPRDTSQLKTPIAIDLYNQAVEFYEKKEYELARETLRDALHYDPKNHLALELLGDISYYEQKLDEAEKQYDAALRLKPRMDLREKFDKVQKEKRVESGLATYREEHFLIKYGGEDKGLEGYELQESLRSAYREVGQDIGYFFRHKVVVLLYDEKEFRELSGVPHWSGGVYDGKIRLPAYRAGFTQKEIAKLMRHELTHAFVGEISRGNCPAWLNEGLAEWEEAKVEAPDLKVFRAAIKTNALFPLDRLMAQQRVLEMKDPLEVQLFYEQSHQLVSYLVERYGMFRIKKMLELFGQGKDSYEATQEILKISPLELERRWKETLSGG